MRGSLARKGKPRKVLGGLASGYRICLSPAENLSYLLGTAEPHLERAIRNYVTPGSVVYDIGANIGFASLALAKRIGPTGQVVAFEPLPENANLLRSSVEHSRLRNVQILQCAASDRSGETIIRVEGNGATASIVWYRNNPEAREITVKMAAIDELVETRVIASPQFVKIDVEGAEGCVLTGMRRTITKTRPVIFVECSDAGRQTAWDILSALHYCCQSALTLKWVTKFEHYRHSDFLWLPQAERLQ